MLNLKTEMIMDTQFVYGLLAGIVIAILVLPIFFWSMETKRKETHSKHAWEKQQSEPEQQSSSTSKDTQEEFGTRDLFIETLKKIGCRYNFDEESDSRIHFEYQGECFFADTSNDGPFVHLYDTYWLELELYKTDEVSRLRKAINTANLSELVTTLFTIDDDNKSMYVHSHYSFIFQKSIRDLDYYLMAILNAFFGAHRAIATEVSILREMEKSV